MNITTESGTAEENHAKSMSERHNTGKARWSLIHFQSLLPMVEVLTFGANKYSPDNWKKGFDKKELLDSMLRHVTALVDGEEFDSESKLHHIGHIMCNAMFYSFHFLLLKKPSVTPTQTQKTEIAEKIEKLLFPVEVVSSSYGTLSVKLHGQTEFHQGKDYYKYITMFLNNRNEYRILEETETKIHYILKNITQK